MTLRLQSTAPLTGDLAAVRQAIDLVRKGKTGEATAIGKTIADPAAQKLVEWFILRHPDGDANFSRYAAFIADNPNWPSMAPVAPAGGGAAVAGAKRRRDGSPLHRGQPASAKGRFALARVLLAEGDRDGAARQVREAWRSEELSERAEAEAFEAFRDLLTREDHRARMDKRIGAKDFSGAMRAARRLGDDDLSIVKACAAVAANATKALDLLDAVATEARQDLGLHAMPYSVDGASRSDCRRDPADAGGGAGDHGASGHGRMVARAACSRPQAARSGQVPDRLSGGARRRAAGQ